MLGIESPISIARANRKFMTCVRQSFASLSAELRIHQGTGDGPDRKKPATSIGAGFAIF